MWSSHKNLAAKLSKKQPKKNQDEKAQNLPQRENFTLSQDDFEIDAQADDIYTSYAGAKYKKKEEFFRAHPVVARLLERRVRNRAYEHYISYEALALLFHFSIATEKYKPKYLFINEKDSAVKPSEFIANMQLADGEDALLVSVQGRYAACYYFYQDGSFTKILFFNPKRGNSRFDNWLYSEVGTAVREKFNRTVTCSIGFTLQEDSFSGATFVFEMAMECVKQKKLFFDKCGASSSRESEIDSTHSEVDDVCLDNLSDVWMNMGQIEIAMKKYQWLDFLERKLEQFLSPEQQQKILPEVYSLPEKLEKILHSLQHVKKAKNKTASSIGKFKQQAENLFALYKREEKNIDLSGEFSFLIGCESIIDKFIHNVLSRGIDFRIPVETVEYHCKLYLFFLVARHAELGGHVDVDDIDSFASDNANKFANLFGNFDEVVAYLENATNFSAVQPIHDACLFKMPKPADGRCDVEAWRALVNKYGKKVISYLRLAPRIEGLMKERGLIFENLTPEAIKKLSVECRYANAAAHPEMAEACLELKVSERDFDKGVSILKSGLKTFDILPDIVIDGELDAEELKLDTPEVAKLAFKKLPMHDWRGLQLGHFTGCCQSLGDNGEYCAIHGMRSSYSSFYVVIDKKKNAIVAQSWTWLGKDGVVVFDSIESKGRNYDSLVSPFFIVAAQRLLKKGVRAVHLGTGGNTPVRFKKLFSRVASSAKILVAEVDVRPDIFDNSDQAIYSDAATPVLLKKQEKPADFLTVLANHIKPDLKEFKKDPATIYELSAILLKMNADDVHQLAAQLMLSGYHLFEELMRLGQPKVVQKMIKKWMLSIFLL